MLWQRALLERSGFHRLKENGGFALIRSFVFVVSCRASSWYYFLVLLGITWLVNLLLFVINLGLNNIISWLSWGRLAEISFHLINVLINPRVTQIFNGTVIWLTNTHMHTLNLTEKHTNTWSQFSIWVTHQLHFCAHTHKSLMTCTNAQTHKGARPTHSHRLKSVITHS